MTAATDTPIAALLISSSFAKRIDQLLLKEVQVCFLSGNKAAVSQRIVNAKC